MVNGERERERRKFGHLQVAEERIKRHCIHRCSAGGRARTHLIVVGLEELGDKQLVSRQQLLVWARKEVRD